MNEKKPGEVVFPDVNQTKHCSIIKQSQDRIEYLNQIQCLFQAILIPTCMALFNCLSWCQCKRTTQERQSWIIRYSLWVSFVNCVLLVYLGSLHTDYFTKTPFIFKIEMPDLLWDMQLLPMMTNQTIFAIDATPYR